MAGLGLSSSGLAMIKAISPSGVVKSNSVFVIFIVTPYLDELKKTLKLVAMLVRWTQDETLD
tara:strand:+ start:1770 stop:1955 length:186 start_codon:yes stop_codon:yes gene_type:complete